MDELTKLEKCLGDYTLGALCSKLAEANLNIYEYENKKWWERKQGNASDKDINEWDQTSRAWNELRSKIKNRIDSILIEAISSSMEVAKKLENDSVTNFQILPISLMIDMLTIENIKIFDLSKKEGRQSDIINAEEKKEKLEEAIHNALEFIAKNGQYKLKPESRTF